MWHSDSWREKPPEQSDGPVYPYENYFVPGPNPAPGLRTNAALGIDPNRLHSPIVAEKPWYEKDGAGSSPPIQRIPQNPLAYNSVPVIPVYVPGGGYETPPLFYQRGWEQHFVPSAGRRPALVAMTPLLQVSRPIKSYSKADAVSQPKRKPMRGRAPKAHKE